jgi:lysine 2,3-aminomutase
MNNAQTDEVTMDEFTRDLLDNLFGDSKIHFPVEETVQKEIKTTVEKCWQEQRTEPIISLFSRLKDIKSESGQSPDAIGVSKKTLIELAQLHSRLDEHGVTVGGRLTRALPIVHEAISRVDSYLKRHPVEAPSGIELWDHIRENIRRIQSVLNISDRTGIVTAVRSEIVSIRWTNSGKSWICHLMFLMISEGSSKNTG